MKPILAALFLLYMFLFFISPVYARTVPPCGDVHALLINEKTRECSVVKIEDDFFVYKYPDDFKLNATACLYNKNTLQTINPECDASMPAGIKKYVTLEPAETELKSAVIPFLTFLSFAFLILPLINIFIRIRKIFSGRTRNMILILSALFWIWIILGWFFLNS